MLIESVYDGARKAGIDAQITGGKIRDGAYIALYGLGAHDRIQHAGKPNVISFDAGYWERKLDVPIRKYRVSIGGFHCPQRIFKGPRPSPERWQECGLQIAQDSQNKLGPILLVGNGPKSNRIGAENWCAEMSKNLREWFPDRKIWYRPKPKRAYDKGVDYDGVAEKINIDSVLDQVSLVVCRHSNVAIDAARRGVPVACDDGMAKAIYKWAAWEISDSQRYGNGAITGAVALSRRTEFLHRLAWWQWSMTEIRNGKFWPWMLEELSR